MNESLAVLLRQSSLMENLPDDAVAQIASVAERIELPAGTVVFREGEPAEDIYLIVSGCISVEICAPSMGCRRILTVGAGDLLSWSPLLEHEKLTATARAMEPTSAIKIRGRYVLDCCEKDVHFGYHFMRRVALVLAQRLNATRLQLLNIYGDPA